MLSCPCLCVVEHAPELFLHEWIRAISLLPFHLDFLCPHLSKVRDILFPQVARCVACRLKVAGNHSTPLHTILPRSKQRALQLAEYGYTLLTINNVFTMLIYSFPCP
jgi:hypothetical protein